jgi:hypothetical protein
MKKGAGGKDFGVQAPIQTVVFPARPVSQPVVSRQMVIESLQPMFASSLDPVPPRAPMSSVSMSPRANVVRRAPSLSSSRRPRAPLATPRSWVERAQQAPPANPTTADCAR